MVAFGYGICPRERSRAMSGEELGKGGPSDEAAASTAGSMEEMVTDEVVSRRAELGRGPRSRDERGLGARPRSLRAREVEREARREASPLFDWAVRDELADRPKTRGDCIGGERPCPWVSCKHHLYLEITDDGRIRYAFPDKEPSELEHSCSLDIADEGGVPLSTVADLVNMTRERVKEIEDRVFTEELREEFAEYNDGSLHGVERRSKGYDDEEDP
jgi:hypothetical protein